jgi:hypothetical protein
VLSKTSTRDKGTRPRRLISSPCRCETQVLSACRARAAGGAVVPEGGSRAEPCVPVLVLLSSGEAGGPVGRTRPGRRGRCPEGPYGPNRSTGHVRRTQAATQTPSFGTFPCAGAADGVRGFLSKHGALCQSYDISRPPIIARDKFRGATGRRW